MNPLHERPPVRRAAVALAKALMRAGGVKPHDLAEVAQSTAPVAPSLAPGQLVTPKPRAYERALSRAGLIKPDSPVIVPPRVPKMGLAKGGEVIIPPGVKVTRCPSGRDTRYTVEGPIVGEFTRDWNNKRKGGKR